MQRVARLESWLPLSPTRFARGQDLKALPCQEGQRKDCPHPRVVRYRTAGGRASRQRERSFGDDLREAQDFVLKVEYDKPARTVVAPARA